MTEVGELRRVVEKDIIDIGIFLFGEQNLSEESADAFVDFWEEEVVFFHLFFIVWMIWVVLLHFYRLLSLAKLKG